MLPERVLLVGGNGFIGQALAHHLLDAGVEVHLALRRPVGADFPGQRVHVVDPRDAAAWHTLLSGFPAAVYLASTTTPNISARRARLEEDNLVSFLTFVEAATDLPEVRLIHFSSGGTLYGNPARLPVGEDALPAPLSPHGAMKVAQEMFLAPLRAQGRAVAILRPANAYGPGQPLKPGFGFIRTIIERLYRDESVDLFGDPVRDYVHVDDVVRAACLCLEQSELDGPFNVGSGIGTSGEQLLALAAQVGGRMPRIRRLAGRPGDVAAVVLDISRLRGWEWAPGISLEAGLRQMWEWRCHKG